MKTIKIIPHLIVLIFVTNLTCAQTTFHFHDSANLGNTGSAFDSAESSIQDTINGITLTAEAYFEGVSLGTDLHGTDSGSFGIDNPNSDGSDLDDGDRFDNLGGVESLVFSFNVAGTFQSIDLRFIEDSANEAQLIFDGGPTFELNLSTDTGGSTDNFNIAQSFTANQLITLQLSPSAEPSENFSLESITVVPELGNYALLSSYCALGVVMIRRRKK